MDFGVFDDGEFKFLCLEMRFERNKKIQNSILDF